MKIMPYVKSWSAFLFGTAISWASLVLGTIYHAAWAWNLFAFLTWAGLIILLIVAFVRANCKGIGPIENKIPDYLRGLEALIQAGFVAAVGHWFYGAIVLVSLFLGVYVMASNEERSRPRTGPVS